MDYLNVDPEPGKWYVSESMICGQGPSSPEQLGKMLAHNRRADKMIIAGPFDSEGQAEDAAKEAKAKGLRTDIWPAP